MRRTLFLAVAIPLCAPAQPAPDRLIPRIRQNMADRLANTPNYTCVLEIDRLVFPRDSRTRFQSKDLSRLEIAVVDGRELFGWPGEASTETALDAFLGPGLTSTGEFSVHGRATFLDDRSTIERLPEPRQTRPGIVGYSYRVPLDASRYVIAGDTTGLLIPYQGEFWADASTGQLLQFTIRIPEAPEQSGLRSIESEVTYAQHDVSGRKAWLPSEARLDVESPGGEALRNLLRFAQCRAFRAESTIRFEETPEESAEASSGALPIRIPGDLDLQIELVTAFDSARVRAGDHFQARLVRDVRYGREVLLPKDALVSGRVRQHTVPDRAWIDRDRRPQRMATLALELLEVRWQGACGRLSATLEIVESIPQMGRADPTGRVDVPRGLVTSNYAIGYETARRMSAQGFGVFNLSSDVFLVRQGARMRWQTEQPPPGACEPR